MTQKDFFSSLIENKLDLDYLKRWALKLGVDQLLGTLLEQAGLVGGDSTDR